MIPAVEDYLGRITPYHRGKPKFAAEVEALAQMAVALTATIASLPADFDLDEAVGVQLDAVGDHVGRSRYVPVPLLDPWFRFGEARRGWGRGVWKGPYAAGSTLAALDDDTYRRLLYAKIAANTWDGTRPAAEAAFRALIQDPATLIWIDDQIGMADAVGIAGRLPSIVFCFLLEQNLVPVKAAGVRRSYHFVSVDGAPLFGFGAQNSYLAGWGSGAWGVSADWLLNHQ